MKRSVIFALVLAVMAFVIPKYGGEPTLFKEYLYFILGSFVAVMVFDLGDNEDDNDNQ